MKLFQSRRSAPSSDVPAAKLGRRSLVAGAGIAGVAAVAVQALQRGAASPDVASAPSAAVPGEGYRLTEHVRRYYESTKT